MSDIHGEYELFLKLLDKIGFSENDELYICGDIIEKGRDSVKLARYIFSMPNAKVIMGNHEDAFIKHYNLGQEICFNKSAIENKFNEIYEKRKTDINQKGD